MDIEAIGQLDIAYKRLMDVPPFLNLDLQPLINWDKSRRRQCQNRTCTCYRVETILKELSGLVNSNKWLIPKKPEQRRYARPGFHQIDLDDAPTIIEPDSETAIEQQQHVLTYHGRIRVVDVKNFLAHLVDIYLRIANDRNNLQRHYLRYCDCLQWLNSKFPKVICVFSQIRFFKVRQKSFESLVRKGHNTLAVAILGFTIEHEINDRLELTDMRRTITPDDSQVFWTEVRRPLTVGWARDRKRNLQDIELHQAAVIAQQYDEIMQQLRRRSPWAFNVSKNLGLKEIMNRADPGPNFACTDCNQNFREYGAVECKVLLEEPSPESHKLCRPCFRQHVENVTQVELKEEQRLVVPCGRDNCKNGFILDQAKRRFLHRNSRNLLKGMVLQRLLNELGHKSEATPEGNVTGSAQA